MRDYEILLPGTSDDAMTAVARLTPIPGIKQGVYNPGEDGNNSLILRIDRKDKLDISDEIEELIGRTDYTVTSAEVGEDGISTIFDPEAYKRQVIERMEQEWTDEDPNRRN